MKVRSDVADETAHTNYWFCYAGIVDGRSCEGHVNPVCVVMFVLAAIVVISRKKRKNLMSSPIDDEEKPEIIWPKAFDVSVTASAKADHLLTSLNGKWAELKQCCFNHTDHSEHFILEPHLHIRSLKQADSHTPIQSSVSNFSFS